MPQPTVVWFRRDLRIADNPALHAAAARGPVVPVFILDDEITWSLGGAARWWLHQSLASLIEQLTKRGAPLILRRGNTAKTLHALLKETGADSVVWNRCYEPAAIARDKALKTALQADGYRAESFNGTLLFEPWELKTQSGTSFKVFTPFWRTSQQHAPRAPLPTVKRLRGIEAIQNDALTAWDLLPTKPDWAAGLRETWKPGEPGAMARLKHFHEDVAAYQKRRDVPGEPGTSRLSPHLAFGEISPHQVWHALQQMEPGAGVQGVMRQLVWREFCTHLLFHAPQMPEKPLRPEFVKFPWRKDKRALLAWQKGMTGYPIVDAGMRELWNTGWMHNRVRMIAASFLVKHLLIPWRAGEDWFWETLVDADLANNSANWQWVAGCGADAAPYFRIFNPVLQGEKSDRDGAYVRRWVPEIARLPDSVLHKPWEATDAQLQAAGIVMGETYPLPIVDHKAARARALAAFAGLRGG